MNEEHAWPRRIITIDDNQDIHRDFQIILSPPAPTDALDQLESDLFGDGAPIIPKRTHEYDLVSACQGQEGVEKIREARAEDRAFALAFVDMRMPPGWDGMETARRIWEVDPDVQIVICTAYSDYSAEELSTRFRDTDSLLILKKPFEPLEILQMANALTEKWTLSRRAALRLNEMRQLVEQRTTELEKANAELLFEIDRRRKKEVELQRISRLDSLTGVANRRVFDEILKEEWKLATCLGQPLSLVMLDLDHFKEYNDHYGHVAGDTCLRDVAQSISHHPKRPRNLFARYGGEEFALILPQTSNQGACLVAERLRNAIEVLQIPHGFSSTGTTLTVSLGVATVIPRDGIPVDSLIKLADQALYSAKHAGRNRVETVGDIRD